MVSNNAGSPPRTFIEHNGWRCRLFSTHINKRLLRPLLHPLEDFRHLTSDVQRELFVLYHLHRFGLTGTGRCRLGTLPRRVIHLVARALLGTHLQRLGWVLVCAHAMAGRPEMPLREVYGVWPSEGKARQVASHAVASDPPWITTPPPFVGLAGFVRPAHHPLTERPTRAVDGRMLFAGRKFAWVGPLNTNHCYL